MKKEKCFIDCAAGPSRRCLPFRELKQLNKQDNTNFNLQGGHAVSSRDACRRGSLSYA